MKIFAWFKLDKEWPIKQQLAIVNPDNVNAEAEVEGGEAFFDDPEVLDRVPTLIGIMTALYAALMTLGKYLLPAS